MRVLVTGGAGFIGSHVVDKLRAAGHEPRIFDLRPSPHHAAGEVDTYIGDLLCVDDLRDAMTDCDAVAHLAASADVGIVANEPVEAEALNARGTLNVLEAARQSGVDRVVYASTIWVYSDGCGNQVDEETTVGLPSHLYTATKLAGEMYCKSYSELYDVEFTILRFGIPYGPRARPAAVIPAFVRKALEGDAADHRRRGHAVAPLRLRRGPGRGRGRRAAAGRRQPRLQPRLGPRRVDQGDRPHRARARRRRRGRAHRGPRRGLRRRGRVRQARLARAGLGGEHAVRGGPAPLHRLVPGQQQRERQSRG